MGKVRASLTLSDRPTADVRQKRLGCDRKVTFKLVGAICEATELNLEASWFFPRKTVSLTTICPTYYKWNHWFKLCTTQLWRSIRLIRKYCIRYHSCSIYDWKSVHVCTNCSATCPRSFRSTFDTSRAVKMLYVKRPVETPRKRSKLLVDTLLASPWNRDTCASWRSADEPRAGIFHVFFSMCWTFQEI